MELSHIVIILIGLFGMFTLTDSASTSTGEAAADDDEIALEDYVDNELPNFSGDVSSSVFGDNGGGYDVHIEVKIANRSKQRDNSKNDNFRHVSQLASPSISKPSQNHEKAKKILDLIIEKLKRRKDAKGSLDDDTDIEISEKDEYVKYNKPKGDKSVAKGERASNLQNEDIFGDGTTKESSGDSSKLKTEKSEINDKHMSLLSSVKAKQETSAFNLPDASSKIDNTIDDFSFKSATNSVHKQPQTNPVPEFYPPLSVSALNEQSEKSVEQVVAANAKEKSTDRKLDKKEKEENSEIQKNVKIKISEDGEIRIKIPEFFNKSSIVSKIVKLVNEDDKTTDHSESDSFNGPKQALVNMESKLAQRNEYKLLLLKKIHTNHEKTTDQHSTPDISTSTLDQHLTPETSTSEITDISVKEPLSLSGENLENRPNNILNKGIGIEKLKETLHKKENSGENQENLKNKNVSTISKFSSEEANDIGSAVQAGQNELANEKDEDVDKTKTSNETPSKNDAFVPNKIASKSFQENLEPDDQSKTIYATPSNNPTEKKEIEIVPLDLHIDEPGQEEGPKPFIFKNGESKMITSSRHKPDSDTKSGLPPEKYVHMKISQVNMLNDNKHDNNDEKIGPFNPGRLFNDSLFQQAGIERDPEGKHKTSKQQGGSTFSGDPNHRFRKKVGLRNSNNPIIDLLTFPSFSEIASTIKENKRKSQNIGVDVKTSKNHIDRDSAHIAEQNKRQNPHTAIPSSRKKSVGDSSHVKDHNMKLVKETKYDKTPKDKEKSPEPANMLNNNDVLSKLAKKVKGEKKSDPHFLTDEGNTKKKTKLTLNDESSLPGKGTNEISPLLSLKGGDKSKSGKLNVDDLASLQLQSKDNLEIGNDAQDDEGVDNEYEDASGDEEDAPSGNPDVNSLNSANLAIWKASEDIHALLHSLTDREHADRVLGNLKNFIKDKHISVPRKRNSLARKEVTKKEKRNFPLLSKNKKENVLSKDTESLFPEMMVRRRSGIADVSKNIQELPDTIKDSFPEHLEVKRRSRISLVPQAFQALHNRGKVTFLKHRRRKRSRRCRRHSYPPYPPCASETRIKIEKRRSVTQHFDKYTNHDGNGIDRLYNQLATSSSRIAPTFENDLEGWSPEEVKNIMSQLRKAEPEDSQQAAGAGTLINNLEYTPPLSRFRDHLAVPAVSMTVSEKNIPSSQPSVNFKTNIDGSHNYPFAMPQYSTNFEQIKSRASNSISQFKKDDYYGRNPRGKNIVDLMRGDTWKPHKQRKSRFPKLE